MKGNKMIKLIVTSLVVLLLSLFAYFKSSEGEPEMYIIPNGYEGEIVIFFDVKSGTPKEFEDKVRVYRIPESGILKTQFSFNKGLIALKDIKFFYEDKNTKQRTELFYNENIPYRKDTTVTENSIVVFSKRYGTGITNTDNQNTSYTSLLVGKVSNANLLFNKRETIHTPDLINK